MFRSLKCSVFSPPSPESSEATEQFENQFLGNTVRPPASTGKTSGKRLRFGVKSRWEGAQGRCGGAQGWRLRPMAG